MCKWRFFENVKHKFIHSTVNQWNKWWLCSLDCWGLQEERGILNLLINTPKKASKMYNEERGLYLFCVHLPLMGDLLSAILKKTLCAPLWWVLSREPLYVSVASQQVATHSSELGDSARPRCTHSSVPWLSHIRAFLSSGHRLLLASKRCCDLFQEIVSKR